MNFGSDLSGGGRANGRLAFEGLKCCPLCNAINAARNQECFVCRWHGEFTYDPAQIEEGLDELVERCPELADVMQRSALPRKSWLDRFEEFLHRAVARWRK